MPIAYYNEHDPFAAAWLRELIKAGHIAQGVVDERSIEDVVPTDLIGFTQCHFFAGVGVWSYALRQAGWPDDRPVWTGSCPCQPFSSAGKGAGFADERHLWPAFFHLIHECGPAIVFGEQVANKDADTWIDLVQADLEAVGYAFGCVPFPSAGVGALHIRDRNFWVADAKSERQREEGADSGRPSQWASYRRESGGVEYCTRDRREPRRAESSGRSTPRGCSDGGVEFPNEQRRERGEKATSGHDVNGQASERTQSEHGPSFAGAYRLPEHRSGPTNGFWRDADWLFCRDGKWRPVEPGTFPLAHGAAARVGRLRGYGNAINAQAAIAFIEAYLG